MVLWGMVLQEEVGVEDEGLQALPEEVEKWVVEVVYDFV